MTFQLLLRAGLVRYGGETHFDIACREKTSKIWEKTQAWGGGSCQSGKTAQRRNNRT